MNNEEPESILHEIYSYLREHPGTSIAISLTYVYIVSILDLTEQNGELAVAVVQATDPTKMAVALFLFQLPFIFFLSLFTYVINVNHIKGIDILLSGALFILVTAGRTWWIGVGGLMTIVGIYLYRRFTHRGAASPTPSNLDSRDLFIRALGLTLVPAIFLMPITTGSAALPHEALTLTTGETFTAQVVSDKGPTDLVLLLDDPRQLLRLKIKDVKERQLCSETSTRTLAELLGRQKRATPKCPDADRPTGP